MRRLLLLVFLFPLLGYAQISGYSVSSSGIGLTVCIGPGSNTVSGSLVSYTGSCLAMSQNATNYGYLDGTTGVLTVNTTGAPSKACPIFEADTDYFQVNKVRDKRPSLCGGGGGTVGAVLTAPSTGQFITTISPTAQNSGFGAGNVPCSSFDVVGLTYGLCADDTNPYNFMATGASAFHHGWNYRYQTDMKQANIQMGTALNVIVEIPASGQVANQVIARSVTGTITGGNVAPAGLGFTGDRTQIVLKSGTTYSSGMLGYNFYAPVIEAGATLTGDIDGYQCDNPTITGTLTGGVACFLGGGNQINTVFLAFAGHKAGGASFAVGSSDINSYCWGTGGQGGVAYVATNCLHAGTGSPNTVITDSPGGMYFDRNGGAWIKNTGSATNTGWLQLNPIIVASLVTTAAASDAVTMTGTTASSHCSFSATNAAAATNIATTFIGTKAANTITVNHAATANMNYDLMCTPN